jgi:uncharacterized DUF497 family protein
VKAASFEWDEQNVGHIAFHQVETDEAEAAFHNAPLILRTGDGKYLAYGQTHEGRYLLVVFVRKPGSLIRVVTARDLVNDEKKQLRRRRR